MSDYLLNSWYVAGWSHEVGRVPLARTLLDTPVVLYRKTDGTPIALHDRCPHRFAPLSRGRVDGDAIECGYHGLCFDSSGACVRNPHSGARPAAARVRSYPVLDRHTAIWIWMGDPAKSDPDLVPDFSTWDDTAERRAVYGTTPVAANYLLDVDNLMDLSHLDYVHAGTIGRARAMYDGRLKVRQKASTVYANWWCPGVTCPPQFESLLKSEGRPVDHWLDMRWDPAGVMLLEVGATLAGRPREEGCAVPQAHFLTPETSRSTHYFWSISRDYALDSQAFDEMLLDVSRRAFDQEDKPMLEAIQQRMSGTDLWAENPVFLGIDSAAVKVRKVLQKLIDAERLDAHTDRARVAETGAGELIGGIGSG